MDSDYYYYCKLCFKCEPTGNLNVTKGVYKRENGNTSTFRNHYRSRHKEVLDELNKKFDDVQKITNKQEENTNTTAIMQVKPPSSSLTPTTTTPTLLKRKLELITSSHDTNNNSIHVYEQRESIARKKESIARETSIRMDIQKKSWKI